MNFSSSNKDDSNRRSDNNNNNSNSNSNSDILSKEGVVRNKRIVIDKNNLQKISLENLNGYFYNQVKGVFGIYNNILNFQEHSLRNEVEIIKEVDLKSTLR